MTQPATPPGGEATSPPTMLHKHENTGGAVTVPAVRVPPAARTNRKEAGTGSSTGRDAAGAT